MSNESDSLVPGDYQHDDVQAVAEYRSVSRAAVWAVVLGCASLLAIFSNLLLVLPLLGVIVALAALRQIASSEGALVGRTAAIVGLALSVVIGAGLVTRNVAMKRLIASQAGPWAIEWCELVRAGKLEAALELARPIGSRRPLDDKLIDFYATNEAAQETLSKFRENPVVKLLTDSAEGCRVERGKALQLARDSYGNFTLVQMFSINPPAGEERKRTREFRLELQKTGPGAQISGVWHVKNYAVIP